MTAGPYDRRSPWLALRSENYLRFFIGQIVSQSGRWMQQIAQAWLVLDLTGSAFALGTVAVAQFTPILAISLFAGPVADRFRKRRFLMALQATMALQAGALATLVLLGQAQVWEIYVLAAFQGTLTALDNPNRQAFVSELVGPAEIQSAVGLNSAVQNAARIAGPAIGGAIIATWGTGWCFAINALAFGVAFAALATMRDDRLYPPVAAGLGRLHAQVLEGLRYVAGERELIVPLALLSLIGGIGYNFSVVLPLLARYTFDVGATGFGLLNAAMGIGSLAGGLMVAARSPTGALALCWFATTFSILLIGLALAPAFVPALLVLAVVGCFGVLFSAGLSTKVQLQSRPEFRGRVLSLYFLVWAGGGPVGGALTGTVAALWDVRVALALNATICLVGCGTAIVLLRRHGSRATTPSRAQGGVA